MLWPVVPGCVQLLLSQHIFALALAIRALTCAGSFQRPQATRSPLPFLLPPGGPTTHPHPLPFTCPYPLLTCAHRPLGLSGTKLPQRPARVSLVGADSSLTLTPVFLLVVLRSRRTAVFTELGHGLWTAHESDASVLCLHRLHDVAEGSRCRVQVNATETLIFLFFQCMQTREIYLELHFVSKL